MMGTEYHLHVNVNDVKIAIKTPLMGLSGEQIAKINTNGEIYFTLDNNYMYLFDKETEENIGE